MRVLRDFGFGKSTLEETINVETGHLFDVLKKNTGKPFNFDYYINVATLNVVWSIVAGKNVTLQFDNIQMRKIYLTLF